MSNKNQSNAYFYYAYYKPRGIECTMSSSIQNSLFNTVTLPHSYFPLGRLDKESEGLLVLTNDGKLYKELVGAETFKEKEYTVTVDKLISEELLVALATGFEIMGKMTRPASVKQLDAYTFSIILTQGLNRQIRKMCYKKGYSVQQLIRTRFIKLTLDKMNPGDLIEISRTQITT